LKTSTDGWISDRTTIRSCFVSHFQDLFALSNSSPSEELLNPFHCSISVEDNIMFCAIPTEFEIYNALASLSTSKAPGSGGFTALFYMKYWNCIKMTVLKAVWSFFRNNHFLKEQNHTFIALIPKKLRASSVHHYRPISLFNIIYKIISKLLANRPNLFSISLFLHFKLFLGLRNIQDNSILAHEMLHFLKPKQGRGGLMAVNIDMEKAFDKMEWNLLLAILHQLGCHPIWINWIQLCISTSSFTVLLNGSPFGLFSPSQGLKQGDPLPPFLFIIGSEVISHLLHSSLRDFKIARSCSTLNHLAFADDLVIFTQATSGEATFIKDFGKI
jgi:hypothetical protein